MNTALAKKAQLIQLLILDIDGVMTDGRLHYDEDGEHIKSFNVKDGLGIKWLLNAGIHVAIITGKQSKMVMLRASHLGIQHVFQNQSNKIPAYETLLTELSISDQEVCYVGDDLPDLPIIQRAGLGIAVADADNYVQSHADWVCTLNGGYGAVREVCELILASKGLLEAVKAKYLVNAD